MTSATPLKTLDMLMPVRVEVPATSRNIAPSLCASNQTGSVNREVNSLDVAAQHRA
jgi:hypothetical protein